MLLPCNVDHSFVELARLTSVRMRSSNRLSLPIAAICFVLCQERGSARQSPASSARLFLAATYCLFGHGYLASRIVQCALFENGSEVRSLEPFARAHRASEQRLAPVRRARGTPRLQARGELTRGVCDIALSFPHMHVNRVPRADTRVHELSLYDVLERFYIGQFARQRTDVTISRA
jgi:hypothetical protein